MVLEVQRLTRALIAEQESLDHVVSAPSDDKWMCATPSAGWTVIDQISHLAYFDGMAAMSIESSDAFRAAEAELRRYGDLDAATLRRNHPAEARVAEWRANRRTLAQACTTLTDRDRLEWYGPTMGARSFITARLMECWAHGEDIRDAVGAPDSNSERLKDVAVLGCNTRRWSYLNRGLAMPEEAVRVELTSLSGEVWSFGPDDAEAGVRGSALDFCLVVTQRRHVDDTRLVTSGRAAREWMEIAQAFAGPPTLRASSGSQART